MEFLKEILSLLINAFTGFLFGLFVCFWLISRNYKLVENDDNGESNKDEYPDTMDDENDFYVLLPNATEPIIICVEEPLQVGHLLKYEENWYEVESVEHVVNGHTTFNLKFT